MTLHGRTQYSDCGDKNCDVAWDLCGISERDLLVQLVPWQRRLRMGVIPGVQVRGHASRGERGGHAKGLGWVTLQWSSGVPHGQTDSLSMFHLTFSEE